MEKCSDWRVVGPRRLLLQKVREVLGAMKRAAVVTIGCKNESLGAFKLAEWLRRRGWEVEHRTQIAPMFESYDLCAFSVVFSWRLPELVQQVHVAKQIGAEVWIGGPAVSFHGRNRRYVQERTGIEPTIGIDDRFERESVDCGMVYFSRGCPAFTEACGVCPVPKLEGTDFRFYPDAIPAKLLMDNNLSALPGEYQDHIIRRYADEWDNGPVDANSGFEPHSFDDSTLERWRKFPLLCWRFGYDDLSERPQALDMIARLRDAGYRGKKVRVYTLIGNEPIEDCHRRIREVIDRECEPVPQRMRPLDWLGPPRPLPVRFDWDEPTLIAYQRFYAKPQLWRQMRPEEFRYQSRLPLAASPI
jgi:hypothetical protein